jgi:hypothetical protein
MKGYNIMAMDLSGTFKAKAIELLKLGKESEARQALELFGYLPADIEIFIKEVNDAIDAEIFGKKRLSFDKDVYANIMTIMPEVEGDMIAKLEDLTANWTQMPSFTISLQRIVNKVEGQPDTVTFSWNTTARYSGTSASTPKTPKAEGETNGKSDSLTPPAGYAKWRHYANAVIPEYVQEYIAKHGDSGVNARRLVGQAVLAGKLEIPAGYTIDQLK